MMGRWAATPIADSTQWRVMYSDFFGLREAPFSITPDPRFYCANSGFDQAYSVLGSALRGKKSVLLLTGEAGCGKTTLLRKLIDELETSLRFVYLNHANLQFEDLIALVCANLGIVCSSRVKFLRYAIILSLNGKRETASY